MADVTQLLRAVEEGDEGATAALFSAVYDELKRLAASSMRRESPGNTLQPTALVHEAYLRLLRGAPKPENSETRWDGSRHFLAAAAEAMRRILIEAARRKDRIKHGGGRAREPIDPDSIAEPEMADELLALDEALSELAKAEPSIVELVKLRYFAGLTLKEAASALGIAPRTATAHWAYARAWLLERLRSADEPASE
ncbi:MAG: sigma-70 family RNA polymerase sigma factor [Gemmataceae bacterium]|nr:sigma-70 family RNA polymerase sigma factor [Gemmataceae bacterium]